MNYSNDQAVAYGWFMLAMLLLMGGIIYATVITFGINTLLNGSDGNQTSGINHDIASGYQSEQSVNAINFNVEYAKNFPLILLFGGFIFSIVRAYYVRPPGV
jgi:hypothetical protein